MMTLDIELQTAIKAVRAAGEAILKVYKRDFEVDLKDDNSPLTEADMNAHHIIVDILQEAFPKHPILSEESVDDFIPEKHPWCFIVDPLDGTKEFIKKNDEFTVNIALTYEKIVVMGVVYAPVFDELYYAVKGHGAFIEENGMTRPIKVSNRTDKLQVLQSRSHQSKKCMEYVESNKDKINNVTRMGSSLKGCRIAKGDYDVYYNCGRTMIWDTGAMEVVIEEAGGILNQLDDEPIFYDLKKLVNDKGFYILNDIRNKL